MANRDLLADAIADAKAVKEVAIANAKAALEEAFTPHLKDMLAQKINEMEDLEETELAEVDKEKMEEEKEMDEAYGKKDMEEGEDMDEGYGKKDMEEAEDMDEELDLEEILAELELEEEELEEGGPIDPGTEPKSFLRKKPIHVQLEEDKDMDEGKKEMDEEKEMDEMKDMDEMEDMDRDWETWFEAFDQAGQKRINYIRRMKRNGEMLNQEPRIKLSTIHRAKIVTGKPCFLSS